MSHPMHKWYNTTTVKKITIEELKAIEDAGVPVELYTHGYLPLGAGKSSQLSRMAAAFTAIYANVLPLPPSPFIEFICDRTSGTSKQDYSATLDGKKGSGKSRSTISMGCRYGLEMAWRHGGSPLDYFTLDNCALLEDTAAISKIMANSKRYQFLGIDDASVALGSRDFAQQKNKNFNRLLTTCRTRRWAVFLNVPIVTHVDLQIRELVDAKMNVYRSYHSAGFNVLKIHSSDVKNHLNKKHYYEKRMDFFGKKFDFWGVFSSEVYGGVYADYDRKYDKLRDEATDRVLAETADEEEEMLDPRGKREKKKDGLFEQHSVQLRELLLNKEYINKDKKPIVTKIGNEMGLARTQVETLLAMIKQQDKERGVLK